MNFLIYVDLVHISDFLPCCMKEIFVEMSSDTVRSLSFPNTRYQYGIRNRGINKFNNQSNITHFSFEVSS